MDRVVAEAARDPVATRATEQPVETRAAIDLVEADPPPITSAPAPPVGTSLPLNPWRVSSPAPVWTVWKVLARALPRASTEAEPRTVQVSTKTSVAVEAEPSRVSCMSSRRSKKMRAIGEAPQHVAQRVGTRPAAAPVAPADGEQGVVSRPALDRVVAQPVEDQVAAARPRRVSSPKPP